MSATTGRVFVANSGHFDIGAYGGAARGTPRLSAHQYSVYSGGGCRRGDEDSLWAGQFLRGIAPAVEEIGEPRQSKLLHALDLYKRIIRPIIPARVFHHTPILPLMEPQPWCVLEYASPEGSHEVAGIFRLTAPCSGRYRFHPRGLRAGTLYRITFDNTGDTVERDGFELQRDGIEIYLESALTSELVIIDSM